LTVHNIYGRLRGNHRYQIPAVYRRLEAVSTRPTVTPALGNAPAMRAHQ
jgi:hypothetical protein